MTAALEMKGKAIGFVGDRTPYSHPLPVILPPKNSWEWASVKCVMDAVAMKAYYSDPDTYGKLWTPWNATTRVDITLPRLIHLPLLLADFLSQ